MKIEIIDSIEKLLPYKTEWENILKEINNDIMFLELDWISNWWKFFEDKHKLFVLLVFNDKEVVGICPFMITNKGICNEIGFIGGRESSSMDFILRDNFREETIGCIFDFLRDIKGKNIIKFHGISEKALNYELIKKYLKSNKVPFIFNSLICYFLDTKNGDINTHFEQRFGKETRKGMNKRENKLKRLGNLVYKRISSSEIDEIFEIHKKRWLRKIGNSSFSEGVTREFYKELALSKNLRFEVILNAVFLNSKIISFTYVIKYNGKVFCVRIAHDDDFYFLSPGEFILKKKVEECFLSKEGILDFGPGYEPYKAKWTDDYEELSTILLPVDDFLSQVIFYINYWIKIKLTNALKKNKLIYNFRKYFLGRLKFLLSKEHISYEILKIKRAVNKQGILVFMKDNLIDLAGKIFSYKKYLLLEKELNSVEIPKGDLLVKEAAIDDLDELSEVMNEAASNIVRRFTNKHKCYITLYKHEIIHYCWINCSNIEISSIKLDIPLRNTAVYIYDSFLKRKYRDESNYSCIFSNIFNLLYKGNFKKCYVLLNSRNKSFDNVILKQIFSPSHKIIEKKIFNITKHNLIDLELNENI